MRAVVAEKDSGKATVAPHVELDGVPWGEYADPDLAYVRGQIGSVGSGALGGWSCSNGGGFLETSGDATREILAEVHRILADKAREASGAADPNAPSL